MQENGRVIVTLSWRGGRYPGEPSGVLAVTGPHQYEAVVGAVHERCRRRMTRFRI